MTSKDLYLRLLGYVKPHRRTFALSLFATVVLAATEPALPALIQPLLDGSFVAKDPQFIVVMPLLLLAIFFVRGVAGFVSAVALEAVAHRVVMDLRNEMFDRLLSLPTRRFNEFSAGTLLSRLTYDVNQVMIASTEALIILVRDSVAVVGLLAWMFYLDWKLSLVTLLIAPAVSAAVTIVGRRLRRLSRELQGSMGELNRIIDESLHGHKVIKVFRGEDYESGRFRHRNNWVRRYNMKLAVSSNASVPLVQFLAAIALAVVIYIASEKAAADEITVGGFVSLFGAMGMLLAPIKRLTKLNEQLQRGLAASESIFGLLDEPPEPDLGTRRIGRAQGRVSFRHVEFKHGDEVALKGVDLDVEPGQTVAIVGPSGSGKTSLVNLLPRFFEVNSGQVLLDGISIAELRLADLRDNIAYVGQEVVLFNDTVAANIAYGACREADADAIRFAAEGAYALEFIDDLPEGMQTMIGEKGARLSGGQRQRLAIARALLKNAPILILDEATSALDTQSERKVQEALDRLRHGRTAFIIAHRLSTIENADRIVVMDKGEIVEAGTHAELLDQRGLYASLYAMQAGPQA